MLPKKRRMTKRLFDTVFTKGATLHSPLFSVKYHIEGTEYAAAVVAPKSVAKTAVQRNSLRRKGYTVLRGMGLKPGSHVIFFYKKPAGTASIQEISDDMAFLLKKARII